MHAAKARLTIKLSPNLYIVTIVYHSIQYFSHIFHTVVSFGMLCVTVWYNPDCSHRELHDNIISMCTLYSSVHNIYSNVLKLRPWVTYHYT